MRKVCVVVTARASYSRIRSVLLALRDRPDVELQIVVAASGLLDRTGRVVETMRRDGMSVDAEVFSVVEEPFAAFDAGMDASDGGFGAH